MRWTDAQLAKELELLVNTEQAQYDSYLRTGSFPSSMTRTEKRRISLLKMDCYSTETKRRLQRKSMSTVHVDYPMTAAR